MAEDLVIRVIGDDAGFTSVMRRVDRSIQKASGSANKASGSFRRMGHSSVSNTQAASAAIRLMEGDLNNMVRAAENFVGRSQVLSSALRTAFPVIGAVAIISVLGQGIARLVEFRDKAIELPQALQDAFQKLNISSLQANDSLSVTNDKLESQIALLEGKNPNELKTALDEDRVAADKLATSLASANSRMLELLKANHIGQGASFFNNEAVTGSAEGSVKSINQKIAGLAFQKRMALLSGDTTKANQIQGSIDETERYGVNWARNKTNYYNWLNAWSHRTLGFMPRQDANLSIVQGAGLEWSSELDHEQLQKRNQADTATLKHLKDQKALDAKRKEAARAALTAERAEQQELVKAWQHELDKQKAMHAMSLGQEANFWIARAYTVKEGSLSYKAALDSAYKLIGQQRKQYGPALDVWYGLGIYNDSTYQTSAGNTQRGSMSRPDLSQNRDVISGLRDQGQAAAQYISALRQSVTLRQQASYALQSQNISLATASGQMSKLGEAQATAALHTEEYKQALNDLQAALQNIANDPTLSKLQKKAELQQLNNQLLQLQTARIMQSRVDNAAITSQTLGGSIRQTFQLYLNQATDTAQQIEDVMMQAFQSVNGSVASALMSKARTGWEYRRNLGNAFGGAIRGVGSSILDKTFSNIEGGFLKRLLGKHGKADGSSSNPFYVRMASTGSTVGSAVSRAFAGGGILGMFGHLFQGFFAGGGDVLANRPAIIGERGPELFVPRSAGTILPNHVLHGGGVYHHYMIDARGSHDPAATEAAVHRGMAASLSMTPGIALHAVSDYRKRVPTSKQRA
jgi:hypothetical protein